MCEKLVIWLRGAQNPPFFSTFYWCKGERPFPESIIINFSSSLDFHIQFEFNKNLWFKSLFWILFLCEAKAMVAAAAAQNVSLKVWKFKFLKFWGEEEEKVWYWKLLSSINF